MPTKVLVNLDPVQDRIYKFIVRYKRVNDGLSPTVREIADGLGMGSTSIQYQLVNLERTGLIRRVGYRSRGIKLIGGHYIPPAMEGQS